MKKVLIGFIVIVVIVGAGVGVWAATRKKNNVSTNNQSSQNAATNTPSGSSAADQSASATITYDGNAFSPSTLTVKQGTVVTVKNTSSSKGLQFSSDPHPTHNAEPELNLDFEAPGSQVTFTPTKIGSWGYHNHLDETQGGTLVVTQ